MKNILFVTAILAGACNSGSAPPASVAPPVVSSITLGRSMGDLESGVQPTSFPFGDMRDLWVRVKVPDMPHLATMTILLKTPNGAVFDGDSQFYSADPTMNVTQGGMGMDAPVLRAVKIDGGYQLDRALPVGGTALQRTPRADGTWGVEAKLSGMPGTMTASMFVVVN